jgi:hypothetical protein
VSANNPALALTAAAYEGAPLTLSSSCTPENPNCTFTWTNGTLVLDANPGLAVTVAGATVTAAQLYLSSSCVNGSWACQWNIESTTMAPELFPSLGLNAWGGTSNNLPLRLWQQCPRDNVDCTWTLIEGHIYSNYAPMTVTAPVLQDGYSTNHEQDSVRVVNGADHYRGLWTLTKGSFVLNNHPHYLTSLDGWGSYWGSYVGAHSDCAPSMPDCRWVMPAD